MPESRIGRFADGIFHKTTLFSVHPDRHRHLAAERLHNGFHRPAGFCRISEAGDFFVRSYQHHQLSFGFAPHRACFQLFHGWTILAKAFHMPCLEYRSQGAYNKHLVLESFPRAEFFRFDFVPTAGIQDPISGIQSTKL